MTDIRKLMTSAIERTENPVAPIIMQEAYSAVNKLAKLMTPIAESQAEVEIYSERLLREFSDAELNKIGGDPAFVIALCALLTQSLIEFAKSNVVRIEGR